MTIRTSAALAALAILAFAACSEDAQSPQTAPAAGGGGAGGSPEVVEGGAGGSEPAAESAGEGGAAGAAGAALAGQGGEGGVLEEGGASGAGGAPPEPDDCELPDYLISRHLMVTGTGRPYVADQVPTKPLGTVPYNTLVIFAKVDYWRCLHKPFCDYAVQFPSTDAKPFTELYWEPTYWQGIPPDGKIGEWIGMCSLGQWKAHPTCGGFYLEGDYVNYKDPTDTYAERYVWECRAGWAEGCDTQAPGTGMAWINISDTYHCYGF